MTNIMLDSALSNVAGPLADFAHKLAGPEGNTRWLPAFKRFLRHENPWDGKPLFTPVKGILIPSTSGFPDYRSGLISRLEGQYQLNSQAEAILHLMTPPDTNGYEVEFAKVNPAMLGCPNPSNYRDVVRALKAVGLKPCLPHEVAELRQYYDEQALAGDEGAYVEALMKPVKIGSEEYALELKHDGDTGHLQLVGFEINDNIPGASAPYICVLWRSEDI